MEHPFFSFSPSARPNTHKGLTVGLSQQLFTYFSMGPPLGTLILVLLYTCGLAFDGIVEDEVEYQCIHDELVDTHPRSSVRVAQTYRDAVEVDRVSNRGLVKRVTGPVAPIRIHLDDTYLQPGLDEGRTCYSSEDIITIVSGGTVQTVNCSNEDVLSISKRDLILSLSKESVELLSTYYSVVPIGTLFLRDGVCGFNGGIVIPPLYSGSGQPDADLVIFLTARPIGFSGVIGYGGSCQDDLYNRPIAGQLNLAPAAIDPNAEHLYKQFGTVLHEITHVLGFDKGKFDEFVTDQGAQMAYSEVVTETMDTTLGHVTYKMITPTVVQWVRDYFDCDTLDGAELENGGDAGGTQKSHWEKRLFMNEYMTGTATNWPVFSGLTMALFSGQWLVPGKLFGCHAAPVGPRLWLPVCEEEV